MHHYRTLEGLHLDRAWATIGSFDGVHRGHQSLIRQMVTQAHAAGDPAIVVTFYPHPAVILRGIQDPYYLTSPDERADLLHELGVDAIITLKFDRELASQSAEEFMTRLSQPTGLRQLWVGPDFALGKGRQGNPIVLQEIGQRLGYTVNIVEQVSVGGERVSSSQIRALISEGKVNEATNMLGRLYGVSGEVVHGDGRGKELGIPTANLQVWTERLLPANGIYATWVLRGNERLASVTNVGIRPTFDGGTNLPHVEPFILDFNQDIYHEQIEVEFVEYFRPEIRYTSINDLMTQIHKDIKQAREVLSRTTRERQVYLLDPQKLNPETIAVTFAKTSRSPQSFREIAAELTGEKTTEFHEKWVVGYGHSSVAEHAVLHIAVENISRLAVECLESNRLASYTEKSTRYQKWGADDFLIPPELNEHPLRKAYQETCQMLFDTYHQALPRLREVVAREIPCREGESEAAWDRRYRTEYIDVCRFVLPASALANVGMTINPRALEHAIRKMLSHPLAEVRSIGEEIKRTAQAEVPTLVKYADAVEYLSKIPQSFTKEAAGLPEDSPPSNEWCKLVHYDVEGEYRVLAAALYRGGYASYAQALKTVQKASQEERQRLAALLVKDLGQFDMPLRELEHTLFTFDITLDQGAYNELKRHRMMTLSPQLLGTHLGYAIPRRFSAAGLEDVYRKAMNAANRLYEELSEINADTAAYVVPNAYNRRVLITLNLRSAFHLLALRSAPNAHFSIRRIAQKMGEEIRACAPLFGKYIKIAPEETWQDIEAKFFTQTA